MSLLFTQLFDKYQMHNQTEMGLDNKLKVKLIYLKNVITLNIL